MTEKDWKQQYEVLLRQHESEEGANRELQELLTRTIIRLTLAANGALFEHCVSAASFSSYSLVSTITSLYMLRAPRNDHFREANFPFFGFHRMLNGESGDVAATSEKITVYFDDDQAADRLFRAVLDRVADIDEAGAEPRARARTHQDLRQG